MSITNKSDNSYERKVLEHEGTKLTYYSEVSNKTQADDEDKKLFVNLSIKELLQGISMTFIAIINDLVSGEVKDFKSFLLVIFKQNRMIYLGLILVFIAFCIYLIDITS